jgi:hypothetical protein
LGTVVSRSHIQDWNPAMEEIKPGQYKAKLTVPGKLLLAGDYEIELKIFCFLGTEYFKDEEMKMIITVHGAKDYNEVKSKNTDLVGQFLIPAVWDVKVN